MGRESGGQANRFSATPSSSSCISAVVDSKLLSCSLGVSSSSSADLDVSVQNLIDKMQNGLKVNQLLLNVSVLACIFTTLSIKLKW